MSLSSSRKSLVITLNFIFILGFLHYHFSLNTFFFSIVLSLMIYLVPGWAWYSRIREKSEDTVSAIVHIISLSFLVYLLGLIILKLLKIEVTQESLFFYIFIATNVSFFIPKRRRELEIQVANPNPHSKPFYTSGCFNNKFPGSIGAEGFSPQKRSADKITSKVYSATRKLASLISLQEGSADPPNRYNKVRILYYSFKKTRWYFSKTIALLLIYGYFYWGSANVIPYIKDHDLVIANPIYGLMKELKPYGLESHFTYIFTKPPLLHFFCGFGVTLSGKLEDSRFFYENAKKTLGTINMEDEKRWNFIKPIRAEDEKIFRKEKQELRFYTRVSCLLPAVLTAFILFRLLVRLSRNNLISFSGTLLFLTIPEVFVRSSYAGYSAPTIFFLTIILYFFLCFTDDERKAKGLRFPLFTASILLALTNHKGLLILPAFLLFRIAGTSGRLLKTFFLGKFKSFLRTLTEYFSSIFRSRLILGALTGTAIFWIYGLSIDHENFFKDHIGYDFIDRYHRDGLRLGLSAERYLNRYPTAPEVWKEFNRNTGTVFLSVSLLSILYAARNIRKREAFLFFWFLVGAVGFSIADWKQTKHFMLILTPLLVSLMIFTNDRGRIGKIIFLSLIALTVIINAVTIYHLSGDFGYLKATPEW